MLATGRVDAIVYDAPAPQPVAPTVGRGRQVLVGPIFKGEAYGIAMPPGSPLRQDINRALLEIRADGTVARLTTRWFGDDR